MIEGSVFYKAFSQPKTLKTSVKTFDPLQGDKLTPDVCGYGIRFFQLDCVNGRINIKQSLRKSVESFFNIDQLIKPILP